MNQASKGAKKKILKTLAPLNHEQNSEICCSSKINHHRSQNRGVQGEGAQVGWHFASYPSYTPIETTQTAHRSPRVTKMSVQLHCTNSPFFFSQGNLAAQNQPKIGRGLREGMKHCSTPITHKVTHANGQGIGSAFFEKIKRLPKKRYKGLGESPI